MEQHVPAGENLEWIDVRMILDPTRRRRRGRQVAHRAESVEDVLDLALVRLEGSQRRRLSRRLRYAPAESVLEPGVQIRPDGGFIQIVIGADIGVVCVED